MKKILSGLLLGFMATTASADCKDCMTNRCNYGDGVACYELGLMYEDGLLYKKHNEKNDQRVCSVVEALYADANCETAKQIVPDYTKAKQMYQKAISYGYAEGYLGLGVLYVQGNGVAKDMRKAKMLFAQACALGNETGCFNHDLLDRDRY